jgi:hypothetical protein
MTNGLTMIKRNGSSGGAPHCNRMSSEANERKNTNTNYVGK